MVANALQLSPAPQKKTGKKQALQGKAKVSQSKHDVFNALLENKKTKVAKKKNPQTEVLTSVAMLPMNSQNTQLQKQPKQVLPTQIQQKPNLQLKETPTLAMALKMDQNKKTPQAQKTLGDVAKLAQPLNLKNLEIQEQKPQNASSQNTSKKVKHDKVDLGEVASLHRVQKGKMQEIKQDKQKVDLKRPEIAQAPQIKPQEKIVQNEIQEQNLSSQNLQNQPLTSQKPMQVGLSELLKQDFVPQEKQKTEEAQDQSQAPQKQEVLEVKKEVQFKVAQARETFNQFSSKIKEEILNYKPPFTKLSMELDPQELGKLEITIVKKGKELQVSVNAQNQHALQAFIQNQNDFKHSLSNVGFNNVELNFSQGEKQGESQAKEQQEKKRNKNSLEPLKPQEVASMEIKMVQYA